MILVVEFNTVWPMETDRIVFVAAVSYARNRRKIDRIVFDKSARYISRAETSFDKHEYVFTRVYYDVSKSITPNVDRFSRAKRPVRVFRCRAAIEIKNYSLVRRVVL